MSHFSSNSLNEYLFSALRISIRTDGRMGSQIRLANLEGGAAGQKLLPKSPQHGGNFFSRHRKQNTQLLLGKVTTNRHAKRKKIGIVFVPCSDVFGCFGTENLAYS